MEVPGSLDFWCEGGVPVVAGKVLEDAFAEDHGGLDDAFDWWHGLLRLLKYSNDGVLV